MSPARKTQAHDAPARRRRPPATHDADDAAQEQSADEAADDEAADDEPEGDEPPDDPAPEDGAPDDEAADDEPEGDEPPDDEASDDEPEDDGLDEDEDSGEGEAPEEPAGDDEPSDPEPSPSGGLDAQGAARRAVQHLKELSHHRPEGVVGIDRDDEGWTLTVEVLEDAHVPSTSDVLAEYEVRLDADGGLRGVTRGRRYVRGRTER
ncbi:gas vesicle protein GvpO [Isoptericola sp. NPDC060257]|uniref:gas vesicle protein GvpO n=1 Tax=Isoptericola sp. NPDC060257 TaxID=3347087 RepID=UPI00365E8B60